ncbi:MAG TPA: pyridoxamine 5'-phosphate oxidase family protein [Acidimicrobiales bacterium]|jgi:nitroimidazol reductase NimA-like FMN-containing flavoprotein (pyridoxamine 5'-phosphate oxidase superfamily)|nr:pyridoxamine 5'-phosphate oxidase family protein [Acidimicrobiales bacterium]
MELDRNGLEILPRAECLRLLTRIPVGRVVVTDKALPAAFPVNFALLHEDVVFMSTGGAKLAAASSDEVVAFQADEIDALAHTGWSVLIRGWARRIVDPEELAQARSLGLQRWAPRRSEEQFHFVRIRSELVSGRRLVAPGLGLVAVGADLREFAGCPSCGSRELLPVTAGATRNFLCGRCAACWHVEDAALRRVDPTSCRGCPSRSSCVAAAVRDGMLAGASPAGAR